MYEIWVKTWMGIWKRASVWGDYIDAGMVLRNARLARVRLGMNLDDIEVRKVVESAR